MIIEVGIEACLVRAANDAQAPYVGMTGVIVDINPYGTRNTGPRAVVAFPGSDGILVAASQLA